LAGVDNIIIIIIIIIKIRQMEQECLKFVSERRQDDVRDLNFVHL